MMRILVAEDEHLLGMALRDDLAEAGHEVSVARDGSAAWEAIRRTPPDLVISDVRMPGLDGMALLARVKASFPGVAFVLMTTFASVKDAVAALQAGASDYLVKPFEREELLERVRRVAELLELRREKAELEEQVERLTRPGLFLGAAPAMQQVWATVDRVAPLEVDVLIEGETGTGKEVLARAIHAASSRASRPFVPVSCAILSGTLLENELFGHEKGAFTGADRAAIGRFEAAAGGTLFLDDVDDIPLDTQAKLLRVLQERKVERLGSVQARPTDFRLVSATKKELSQLVAEGRFRQDLYYRLHVIHLPLPPLRERREDILPLAGFFLRKFAAQRPGPLPAFQAETTTLLRAHAWPGNVRELEHVVQAALALCAGPEILPAHLPKSLSAPLEPLSSKGTEPEPARLPEGPVSLDGVLAETEKRLLHWALERAGGNQSDAAALLGIPRSTFQYRARRQSLPGFGKD
ncbi:MAG: sigma-54 dependent transcriptional regulator [Geothrix sp.]|nr:sigma-54 dependent transcriptional regulator [Geothrix sp.]